MNNTMKMTVIGFCAYFLSSCEMSGEQYSSYEPMYTYSINNPYPSPAYYRDDYPMNNYPIDNRKTVVVPNSYYVGETHSPVSSKDLDKNWVSSQNSQGYTIEIADGEKASQVAQALYKAPKNERTGQVRYQRQGKTYYKGLYGSYDSPEAAQKALDALPSEIKKGAGVKNWGR